VSIIASWGGGRSSADELASGAEWLVTCMFAQHFALTTADGPVDGSVTSEWTWLLGSARQHISWRAPGTAKLSRAWSGELGDGRLDARRTSANLASEALDSAARIFTDAFASTLVADDATIWSPLALRRGTSRRPAVV
jgi:hypothetical protein